MKLRIARKQMAQLPHLYRVGYCGAQSLLTGLDPVAYTTGLYGWNCDVYALPGGVHICTGYRGLAGDRIPELDKWEWAAQDCLRRYDMAALDNLRRDLAGTLLTKEVTA